MSKIDLKNPTGMILDGVAASQAIDSSGEVLDVEGCDITSLPVDGTINVEHMSADDGKVAPGEETVGKILYAKKIFKAGDCETEREHGYWDEVRVPFIYIIYRLYDRAGHRGAKALAAQIRDAVANKEKILVRLSIEGSTLTRQGNVLKTSVARRVSATIKPCNRTCNVGLLADPDAPAGFEKDLGVAKELDGLKIVEKAEPAPPRHQHPLYTKLGGVWEGEGLVSDYAPVYAQSRMTKSLKLLIKAQLLLQLKKALTAGSYGAAPSSLSGGAALQREATPLRDRLRRAAAEYQPKGRRFDKAEFKAFAKTYLPEVDDGFLDHFADVAEDFHAKRLKKDEGEYAEPAPALPPPGDEPPQPQENVQFAPGLPEPKPKKGREQPGASKVSWIKGPNPHRLQDPLYPKGSRSYSVDNRGRLTIPDMGTHEFHVPGPEYGAITNPESRPDGPAVYRIENEKTGEIVEQKVHDSRHELYRKTVHEPWERAMDQWIHVNKALREGRLPKSLMRLAVLMSAMSPNTAVPAQERHFGHIMDMIHEGSMPLLGPVLDEHADEALQRTQGHEYPRWMRHHYEVVGPKPGVDSAEEAAERAARPNAWGNPKADPPSIMSMRGIETYAKHLEHLVAQHGQDARAISEALMNSKAAYERRRTQVGAAQAYEEAKQQGISPVLGFGPKLLRYALGMMGGGNVIVPDRHMARSLYNFDRRDPKAKYVAANIVQDAKNERFLRAMDQNFYNRHPAVQYVLNHPKYAEHFRDHPEQAIFPAFWLHWLHIPHYEQLQGRDTDATIGGTDHKPFWVAAQPILDAHGIPVAGFDRYHYSPALDDSFDFGANVAKAEGDHHDPSWDHVPLIGRALGAVNAIRMRHGDIPASMVFFSHVVPHVLASEDPRQFDDLLRRFEVLSVTLRKSIREAQHQIAASQPEPEHVLFGGRHVQPGRARHAGGEYALLNEDATHFVAVPAERLGDYDVEDMVRLPKALRGTHYVVTRQPSVPIADLE